MHNPTYPPSKTDVGRDIKLGANALKHESFLDIEFGSLQKILSVNHRFETAVRTIQNLSQQGIRMVISDILQLSEAIPGILGQTRNIITISLWAVLLYYMTHKAVDVGKCRTIITSVISKCITKQHIEAHSISKRSCINDHDVVCRV